MDYLLQMQQIVKRFGGFTANDHIDFDVMYGEIHSLLGENGAGKSTLMNILCGLYRPDEGRILLHGKEIKIESPKDSIALKIGMIHQSFMLIPKLNVLNNIILGSEINIKKIDIKQKATDLAAFSERIGMPLDPYALVGSLSVGEQQRVEIVKALYRGADLLILDEPTSVLTPQESSELFSALRKMTSKGMSAIFISHKLDEVMEISDRISVLRQGKKKATCDIHSVNKEKLIELMIGRDIYMPERESRSLGESFFTAQNLTVESNKPGINGINNLSFEIKQGEILGIGGVDGNGQQELAEALAGIRKISSGSLTMAGEDIAGKNVFERTEAGIAYVPADRKNSGIFQTFDLSVNLLAKEILHRNPDYCQNGLLRKDAISHATDKLIQENHISAPSAQTFLKNLSGGNQQKTVIARERYRSPKLLIVSLVTLGLDLGASEQIRTRLRKISLEGTSIIYISSDLEELLEMSDRVMILFRGENMGIFSADKPPDINEIGLMMTGTERISV